MKNLILMICVLLAGLALADCAQAQYPAYYGTPGYVMPYGSTGTYYRGYDSRVASTYAHPGAYYRGGYNPWGYGGGGYSYDYSYYRYYSYSAPKVVTVYRPSTGIQAYAYMNANGRWVPDGWGGSAWYPSGPVSSQFTLWLSQNGDWLDDGVGGRAWRAR